MTRWEPNRTWGIAGLFLELVGSFLNPAVPTFGFTPERLSVFGLPAVFIAASTYTVPPWLRINAEEHAAGLGGVVALNKLELSRELHDVVGHGLTSIKVQAQTALCLAKIDDSRAERATEKTTLESIAETAEQSLRDVHALVDTLREGNEISTDLNKIPHPVSAVCPPGRGVSVTSPESYGNLADWPLTKWLTLMRAVTELVTNTAKHSSGGSQLALAIDPLADVDDSPTRVHLMTASRAESGTLGPKKRAGTGLIGLDERVAQLSSEMTYGETDGIFRVGIRL